MSRRIVGTAVALALVLAGLVPVGAAVALDARQLVAPGLLRAAFITAAYYGQAVTAGEAGPEGDAATDAR